MDTRIPLGVQPIDFAGAMQNGLQAGTMARQAAQQNALAQLYQTQGPQIMAGNPQALNALAQMDPMAAQQAQQGQLGIQQTQMQMQEIRDRAKAAVAEHAAKVNADQLAAEAAQTETMLRGAAPLYMAAKQGDPQAMGRLLSYLNSHGIQATPDNVDTILYASSGALEGMKTYADMNKQPDPMRGVPSGYLPNQPGNLAAGVTPIPGYAPQPQTVVNTGENSSAFAKKSDELAAQRMSDIVAAGASSQQMVGDLGTLAEIAKGLETGLSAQVMAQLGPYADALGLPTEGLAPAQAYDAIISRMAPQMRPAGSGAASDFDAKQFLKSLPQLGNTPEGNAIISATLQAVQEQKVAAADIAQKAFRQEITWQEADKQIAALGNPFDQFNKFKGLGQKAGSKDGLSAQDVSQLSAVDIKKMDLNALKPLDPNKMDIDQLNAYNERMRELLQ